MKAALVLDLKLLFMACAWLLEDPGKPGLPLRNLNISAFLISRSLTMSISFLWNFSSKTVCAFEAGDGFSILHVASDSASTL